ncbi:MAG: mechanosensitive ion channel family protein, partial [Mesotoga sp.]
MNEVINTIIEWAIRIGISIVILLVAKWLAGLFYKAFLKFAEKTSVVSTQYQKTMRTLFNLAFYALATFIIVSVLFKNLAPVLAGLGVSGIIVGLAVKEPLENFICGILIMIN